MKYVALLLWTASVLVLARLFSGPRCTCWDVRCGRATRCGAHDVATYGKPDVVVGPRFFDGGREAIVPIPDDFARRLVINGRRAVPMFRGVPLRWPPDKRQAGGITREPGIQ